MQNNRKIEVLDIEFTSGENVIRVEFYNIHNKYCIMSFMTSDFEQWLDQKGYLNIDYETYNPVTGDFKSIAYTITEADFFSEDQYQEYRERLIREYVSDMLK
ncbi:MAG TPA: hypothetical protein VD908_17635 [Cytophagales bacterium]|nr:hypothetical protein [Cytophagales bacterium]